MSRRRPTLMEAKAFFAIRTEVWEAMSLREKESYADEIMETPWLHAVFEWETRAARGRYSLEDSSLREQCKAIDAKLKEGGK